jgi:hypothetical protein
MAVILFCLMNSFSPITKVIIMVSASALTLCGSIYLYLLDISAFWTNLIVGIVTILLPLFGSLFLYTGKLAKAAFVFALVAGISVLVLATDLSAVHDSIKSLCASQKYTLNIGGDYYLCESWSHTSSFTVNFFSGSALTEVAFCIYFMTTVFGSLNLLIMPIYWFKHRKNNFKN